MPANQVQVIKTKTSWEQLGALPEMMQTAWGSLFKSLQLKHDDELPVQGGTTSLELATAALAKSVCVKVAATTCNPEREGLLRAKGASEVFIDNSAISEEVRMKYPNCFSEIPEYG